MPQLRDAKGHFMAIPSETTSGNVPQPPRPQFATLKTTIATIALPLAFLIFFLLGKWQVLSQDKPATRLGILRTSQGQTGKSEYHLLEKNGHIYTLVTPDNLVLTSFQNRRVLVTGLLSEATNTIQIASQEDIESVSPNPR